MRKMKNHIFLIFIFLSVFLIIGCDFSPVYTVLVDEEAIVTQNGEVIGDPKEPGLHFKIPILQEVHKVNVFVIREFSLPVPKSQSLHAKIMWTVKDSKKFFVKSKKGNINQLVESTATPVFYMAIQDYDLEAIFLISKEQNRDYKYTDNVHSKILKNAQDSLDDFGIKLYNIVFDNI
jgi:regulator of protease activity HflC (stomatin/prohibitin superfamily)